MNTLLGLIIPVSYSFTIKRLENADYLAAISKMPKIKPIFIDNPEINLFLVPNSCSEKLTNGNTTQPPMCFYLQTTVC